MTRYLISFDDGEMTSPEGELPDVAAAAQEVREFVSVDDERGGR